MDLGELVLDIGGLDQKPVDRGLTVRRRGDLLAVSVGDHGVFSTIELSADEVQRLRDALVGKQTLEEQATEAFDTLFSVLNKMVYGEEALINALNAKMEREHRTLIQQWWGVIATVIKKYALTKDGWFDLRNEDSIKWAREVAKVESGMRFI